MKGRGCHCSLSQNQGGVPFPPCVSRLPSPSNNSCTLSLCGSFTLYSYSHTQNHRRLECHHTPDAFSPQMKQRHVGQLCLKNKWDWIHSSVSNVIFELDVLYFLFSLDLSRCEVTFLKTAGLHRPPEDMVGHHFQIHACCIG